MTDHERGIFYSMLSALRQLTARFDALEHQIHLLQERMLIYDAKQFAHEITEEGIPRNKIN